MRAAIAFVGLLFLSQSSLADRTDVVILRNGDRITGEIKKLQAGRLEYKTDDMDRVYIEWEKIHHVTSVNRFEIIDVRGIRRYGSIGRTEAPYEIVINTPVASVTTDLHGIVRITPIKAGFLQRLKGSISTGFSYTRATKTTEFTLSGDTSYRGEKYSSKLDYSAYITDQAERRTSRYNTGLSIDRFLKRRWTVGGLVNVEHNEELGLDLRLSLTASGSRYVVESNKTIVRFSLGIAGTRERYIGSDSTSYNLESPITAEYSRFTFQNPKSNIQLSGVLYPNLTTKGRYRGSLNADLNHEIYKDLFFVIGSYYDYDSKPPKGAAKEDYRFNTSIRWTFG
jgi:hypothetical protein